MELELGLLEGFRFTCRPGCGLCCYATPAVSPAERSRLVQIEPTARFLADTQGFKLLAARPEGGACTMLGDNRCRVHAARPFPCRVFPLLTHIGTRIQSTLVLSCPGVDLSPLESWSQDSPSRGETLGLDSEIAAARKEAEDVPVGQWLREGVAAESKIQHALRARGEMQECAEVLRELSGRPLPLGPVRGGGLPPPGRERPIEELPLTFEAPNARVALRSVGSSEYEVIELRESGGVRTVRGTYPVPERWPEMQPDGRRVLEGYGRYLLARDHFLWAAYHELRSGSRDSLKERLRANVAEALAEVVRRGTVLALAGGHPSESLGVGEVAAGIRAVDAELLDRPTLGRVL